MSMSQESQNESNKDSISATKSNNLEINTITKDCSKEFKGTKKEVWVNAIKADGGAYKGCPKNDYCQHFVDTSERPQNFIRDYEEEKRFLDYPKLNELIKRKNEVLQKRATPPMWLKCDLKSLDLSTMGKFDVILVDPPLQEYQQRAEGLGVDTSNLTPWSFEEIANIRIDLLAENCCFLFLWVGSSDGLDKGRLLLKKWNFRRCEDIVWIKTNKHSFKRRYYNDNDNLLQHTKEHCLVGIKGQVKRGVDGHFIHANIDTDVIVSEEPPLGLTEKPQELYRIIERFCLGRKRIELFGEDHNRRPGWLTLGKSLSSSNFDIEKYNAFFKGELCFPEVQGYEGGRFVGCTAEIENLRPRSPSRTQITNIKTLNTFTPHYATPSFINNFGIGMTIPSQISPNYVSFNNNYMSTNTNGINNDFYSIMNNSNNSFGTPFEYSSNMNNIISSNSINAGVINPISNNTYNDENEPSGTNLINNSNISFNQNS